MKFNEIPYKRFDIDEASAKINKFTEELRAAGSASEARKIFSAMCALLDNATTAVEVCMVRYTIDTRDAFYQAEREYYDENIPRFSEAQQAFMKELVQSRFRPELEKEFGALLFKNAEMELKTFSPEIIPDLQEENRLATEYQKLIASAQIDFDGKKLTLSELTPYKQNTDRAVRKAAWEAEGGFFKQNEGKLDEIYDKLVKVRTRMAKKLGFDNFVELGYLRMTRNCYGKTDVEAFRAAVKKYIVPVSARLKAEQAKRLGLSGMSLIDNDLMFKNGNADPEGTAEDILEACGVMYRELSPETGRLIDFLYKNEMLDVKSKAGKAGGGYCTELPDYKTPFIFANFNGTAGDVGVMTHEAGHAFAFYTAMDAVEVPMYRSPTIEACEVHSMAMEYLTWPWAEKIFGAKTEKFKYAHLSDAVNFIPYGTIVDAFQHIMYENPDMTPEERHAEWFKLEREFRPYLELDGVPAYEEGQGWHQKGHIFEAPFYYIDYCLAQTIALQLWALSLKDHKAAWDKYHSIVKIAGTKTFTEIVEMAGLKSPFDEDALGSVSAAAAEWLDSVDTASLDAV